MNDKDRDLIAQVLKAAGQAGERGFEYLVRYTFTSGLTELLSTLAVIAFCAYLFTLLRAWKPKEPKGIYNDNAEAYVVRGAGMVALCVVLAIAISSIGCSLGAVLSPEGAAIYSVLHK